MINTITEKLLSGEGILARGIPGWCLVISSRFFDINQLNKLHLKDEIYEAYMPLPILDHLQMHCTNVPDLAWDMLDFAEDPLIICIKGVKNLGDNWDGDQAIMGFSKLAKDDVSLLASKLKEPLLAFPLSGSLSYYSDTLPELIIKDFTIFDQSEYRNAKYKVFFLEKNGTIHRLRG